MLEDLDWLKSEDSLVTTMVKKFCGAGLSPEEGADLARFIAQPKPLSADIVERIARRVAAGMREGVAPTP
jgi:hypothetical protein